MSHHIDEKPSIDVIIPPSELTEAERLAFFEHFFRRLAAHRNQFQIYAIAESGYILQEGGTPKEKALLSELDHWAQDLLNSAWAACQEPGGGTVPKLDAMSDTSTATLPSLPSRHQQKSLLSTVLFLHITHSKSYSSHTRAFVATFGPIDETGIVNTLKNPDHVAQQAQEMTEQARQKEAEKGKTLRYVGMGLAGLAGGALIGVTGGLAAPLVGTAIGGFLTTIGVGGTAAGMLATGLATSSVVCGTLFGAYGAKSSAAIVERHMREVRDLAVVPVRPPKETLAVRLCVSGWLDDEKGVTAPWTVFGNDCDTYALQWEVKALQDLSNALNALVKSKAMGYIKAQIIKRTILAGLMAVLSPTAWLQFGQIIDNPWMNAKALAVRAGTVLGQLLAQRVFGTRPVTLTGYSLGSLVIFEALKHLASLPPSQSVHLVQDVYLFGLPAPTDARTWTGVRRVVAGRLVNGYSDQDYILAVLSRASDVSWEVAGLGPVQVKGVENIQCEGVEGHLKWRGRIGKCLHDCGAPGVDAGEVEKQLENIAKKIDEEVDISEQEAEKVIREAESKPEGH